MKYSISWMILGTLISSSAHDSQATAFSKIRLIQHFLKFQMLINVGGHFGLKTENVDLSCHRLKIKEH